MSVLEELAAGLADGSVQVLDLSQPLGPETPVIDLPPDFAPSPGVTFTPISRYDDAGPAWYWRAMAMGEHTGTHFDAPVHWITGKDRPDNTCDTLPVGRCVGPACVLDIRRQVAEDADFLVTPEHLRAWEDEHGRIAAGSWFLLASGWSEREGAAFLNQDEDGPHSPGLTGAAVQFLIEQRDVLGVGVETVGTDAGCAGGFDPPFPVHHHLAAAGRYGLASLAGLHRLPATGAVVVAAPLKLVEGSGSPLRVLALVDSAQVRAGEPED